MVRAKGVPLLTSLLFQGDSLLCSGSHLGSETLGHGTITKEILVTAHLLFCFIIIFLKVTLLFLEWNLLKLLVTHEVLTLFLS